MNPKMLATSVVAITMAAGLLPPGELRAQTGPTHGNLQLKESGSPRGYAFLLPIYPTDRYGARTDRYDVILSLRPDSTIPPPDQWTWHVDESEALIKSLLTFNWYAQASCPDDLTSLQVSGPAGTLTQNPLWNPIWGYFSTQSYTVDTVEHVCTAWANSLGCDPTEPGGGCPLEETFDLVGGVSPASAADTLRLKGSCLSAPLPTLDYGAKLRLTCRLAHQD